MRPRPFGKLLAAEKLEPPDDLLGPIGVALEDFGGGEPRLWLVDYEQAELRRIGAPLETAASGDRLPVEGTMAGRAFRGELVESTRDGSTSVWVPVVERADRIGVLELVVPESSPELRDFAEELGLVVAHLIRSADAYTDRYHQVRRREAMSLAAEIQWNLLPPTSYQTSTVAVAGQLEPAYDVGGDTFDYAHDGDRLHFAITDAMGHGLDACMVAALALGTYRHARRRRASLAETARAIESTVGARHRADPRFLTGVLAELRCDTGALSWVNAGHPSPLLLRHGRVIGPLECSTAPLLGLGLAEIDDSHLCTTQLEPDDQLLLYTDGVVDTRSGPGGDRFGEERLADFLVREAQAGMLTGETLRRLTRALASYRNAPLEDDATVMLVAWHGPRS